MATSFLAVKNRAVSTLLNAVDAAVTSWTLASGGGANFPSTYPFDVTCEGEIVRCTNRSVDVLTVTRAQQGTTAGSHAAGEKVELRITAQSVTDLNAAVNTLENKVLTKALAADQSNSTVTPTKVTGLDVTIGVGTWVFQYFIRYQAAALTTGVRFDVNHSGTVTTFLWQQRCVDTSATASTNAPDQDQIIAAGGVMSAMASRAKGTAGRGTTLSVDTINANMLMIIEGLVVVTVAGDIQLYHGSEVAAASTVKQDSSLILTKIA